MAVKLMPVAQPVGEGAPAPKVDETEQPKQPRKRRRAAVYDADGNEVLITLKCLKCNRMHPLSNFGLRKMADGAIRNQPWCRECRGASSPKKKKGEAALVEAIQSVEPQQPVAVATEPTVQAAPPAVVGVDPSTPQYGQPMQVVALTAEQVMRALAPQAPQAVPAEAPADPASPTSPEPERQ